MTNRLAKETSPYLRQHADNPVDWWPWCEEALATARRENKPILLSIGYAACHWCHVMAHESFEDAATAQAMNARYVNIKVDREERPDIDKVYQLAHQALARRGGGWPLTMFLTPDDRMPFFAGTYFPKTPRYNMPAFVQVVEGVRRWFDEKPAEVRAQNDALARFLANQTPKAPPAASLDASPLGTAFERMARSFDAVNGGRHGAPKFPHASEVEWLLAFAVGAQAPAAERACEMARLTLQRMATRGLRDHLGGGFFRYCVDAEWEIPHFEKMLYDNAQLMPLFAAAASRFDEATFADAARDCADWLVRSMSAPEGGYWSSLDADSEGEEGRYYVWQRDQIRALLDDAEFALVDRRFGLGQPPNFEHQAWHLREVASLADCAAELGIGEHLARERWDRARATLYAARSQRVPPGLDDKILTAWNALAIGGAARTLKDMPQLAALREQAERALSLLRAQCWQDGRLLAVYARGAAKGPAYLDDHAFLLDALLAMLQLRWRSQDLEWAIALADALLDHFEDRDHGGFYFTAHDAEVLPQRPKPFVDESLPSGNGVAARALLSLGHLVGESRYLDAAERTLRAAWPMLTDYPQACCSLLLALDEFLQPRTHVVIRYRDSAVADDWRDVVHRHASQAAVYAIDAADDLPASMPTAGDAAGMAAFVCRGTTCLPIARERDELRARLTEPR